MTPLMRAFLPIFAIVVASTVVPRGAAAEQKHPSTIATACGSEHDAAWSDQFGLPFLNGWPYALAVFEGDLIVGGDFNQAALSGGVNVARWNGTAWSALGEGVPSPVSAFTEWNGHLVAGCDLPSPNLDQTETNFFFGPRPLVFEFDGTSWAPLGIMNHLVHQVAAFDGDLYAIGNFTIADGNAVGGVARWSGTEWEAVPGSPYAYAYSAEVFGGQLVVGGDAGTLAWNGTSWSALGDGLQAAGGQEAYGTMTTDGTSLYVSASATQSGATPIVGIARWDGTAWSSLPPPNNVNIDLAIYQGDLVATGNGNRTALFDGVSWNSLGDQVSTQPRAVIQWGNDLIAAGPFQSGAGGGFYNGLARYDGIEWTPLIQNWSPGMSGRYQSARSAIELDGDLVVSGGAYAGAEDHLEYVSQIGAWDGSAWSPFGVPVPGPVFSLTQWGDSLIAAGGFFTIGGVGMGGIALWNGSAWQSMDSGFQAILLPWLIVYDTAVHQGDVFATGMFTRTTSTHTSLQGIARWDGASWQPLGTGFDVSVASEHPRALLSYGGDLVAAGRFATAGGVAAANIARWDGSAWHALGDGVNDLAYDLVEFEGDLIVGGEFTEAGGASAAGVARWNGTSWSAMGDNAVEVEALRVIDGRLFAAGAFLCPDLSEVTGLAVWNGTDWQPLGSGFGPAEFWFIEPYQGDIYVGGEFGVANGHPSFNIARWSGASLLDVAAIRIGGGVKLAAPRPNPSTGMVAFEFDLPVAGHARLAIYDLAGRHVATLAEGAFPAGTHRVRWSGEGRVGPAPSAVYFARLESDAGVASRAVVRLGPAGP